MKAIAALLVAVVLVGCGVNPPGTAPPADWMMVDCPELPDVPENEGSKGARRDYNAATRKAYGQCRARHAGLKAYARATSEPAKK